VPLGQLTSHAPPAHTSPVVHVVPQSPQCSGSVLVSTQSPPHCVYPAPHVMPQPAVVHTGAPFATLMHALSQAPQFAASESSFTHAPSHSE
jgi:hypothetical protein